METLDVPESGLSLSRDHPGNDSSAEPSQIMRLDLAQNTLDDLIQSLRNNQPARIRLGKHPTLYYGSKSQQFHSAPESHPSEIYTCSSADKENLYFTGVLSHNLEVQKAKEATAATDQALATLEQSLNAFERGKESKQTHIITDIDEVRALKAGDNRSSTGRQAASLARRPTTKVEIEKDRLLKNAASRSVSSSPSLGVARSPNLLPSAIPTSAPLSQNKAQIRLDALKVPFIHLLAVRPVSVKFLAQQTRSSLEDCQAFVQKYGTENRDNRDKFDLRDKAFRELDVWKFPYPSQEDRDQAVKNAISAFDRMRISRIDKLWQMLLPREERGKGKCLSRLDLRGGPIKKPVTPRIQVQSEDAKDEYSTGHETDRAGNNLTPKSAEAGAARRPATQKKRAGEKAPAKNKSTNSTLTGRITKKTERKPAAAAASAAAAAKPDGKFKSAEYIQDSDDDMEMADTAATEKPKQETKPQRKSQPEPQSKPEPKQSKPQPKPEAKPSEPNGSKATRVPTPKTNKPEPTSRKPEPSPANKGVASKRPPSANPSFPRKPSPLGSSPPTNASDIQTHSRSSSTSQTNPSSSSSSPLITQVSKAKQTVGTGPNATKVANAKPNGVVKSKPTETINPLKRKAEAERPVVKTQAVARVNGTMDNKRRRAVSTSSASTGSASPPLSRDVLLQQLREKSQLFKQRYTKYRTLHDAMAAHSDPPLADLERLRRQHARLQEMKEEIWDEDRRLRGRI